MSGELRWVLPDDGLRTAACRAADPSPFEATQPREAAEALAFCARCPVTDACLAARPTRAYGVWGGQVWVDGRLARNQGRPHRGAA